MSKFATFFKEHWALSLILTLSIMCLVFGTVIWQNSMQDKNYAVDIYRDNMEIAYEGARANFIKNVDLVIREVAPSTCVNGLAIVRGCEKYNIDVFFVLAQGQLESHYGTKGMAQKTNSVFNVYAYDGYKYDQINKNGKFSHPDLSIEPYLILLKKHYLVNGKTEQDLMIDYVNESGQRYASNPDYETRLLETYRKFILNESLQGSFKEYNKYKILSGN